MRDRFGLLPPHIAANYEKEEMVDDQMQAAEALATALHQLDPNLSLTFFGERALPIDGIIPNRWHVCRKNESTADSYMPIVTPDGGYREPAFDILEELRKRDGWGANQGDSLIKARHRKERVQEAVRELASSQRKDEMREALRAGHRVSGEGGLHKRLWGRR